MSLDPWAVLELEPGSEKRAIKSAYRRLARRYHPDTNPGDAAAAERFLAVCEAYQTLTTTQEQAEEAASPDTPTPRVVVSFLHAFTGGPIDVELPVAVPCRRCGGKGCGYCHQTGQAAEGQRFVVDVPRGVYDGMPLEAREHKGTRHLLVSAQVSPSPLYQRLEGRPEDLLMELPITVTEAALGATVRLPAPTEIVSIRVPPGTQDGKVFRLAQNGFAQLKGEGFGDLIIKIKVNVPTELTGPQRKMYEELARYETDPRADLLRGR